MRPMADRLSPFMRELCRMETLGGRCTRLNNDKWEINDVGEIVLRHSHPKKQTV